MKEYRQQWYVLGILFLAWGVIGLARNGINYLFPYVQEEFQIGSEHMGFLAAILAVCWAMAIILSGKYYSKIGPTKIIVPGLAIAAFCIVAAGMTKDIGFLYLCMAVVGLGAGSICAPSFSMISQYSDPKNRGAFMGVMQSSFQLIGVAGGSIVLTYLGGTVGWRIGFLCLGGIVFVFGIMMLISLRKLEQKPLVEEGEVSKDVSTKEIFVFKNMKITAILTCCCMVWSFTIPAYAIIYLIEVKGFSAVAAGAIFSGFGLGGFLGNVLGPAFSDFIGRKPALILASILNVICFGLFVTTDASATILSCLLFLAAFFFFSISPIIITVIPSETVPKHLIAKATSFTPSIGEIFGGVLAPVLAGALIGVIGLKSIMECLAIVPLCIFFFGFFIEETAPRALQRKGLLAGRNQEKGMA